MFASDAAARGADPRENVGTLVDYAIDLLDQGDHKTLIEELAHPDDLKKLLVTTTMDEVLRGFQGEKAKTLLAALREIQGSEPLYNADKTRATFHLKAAKVPRKTLTVDKLEKYWYLRN